MNPLDSTEIMDAVIDRAADKLVSEWREEFFRRMAELQSFPLHAAAGIIGCHARTIERNAPVFGTGQRDKSITLKELEAFRQRFTKRPTP